MKQLQNLSSQAEVEALKRLQDESRHRLHAPLAALLPAILPSSLRFAATNDRAFKG